jgi:hypothetical protein
MRPTSNSSRQPRRLMPCAAHLMTLAAALVVSSVTACSSSVPAESIPPDVPTAEAMLAAAESGGLVRVQFPQENPGIPAYARLGNILDQIFHDETWLVVPFYRQPDLIPGAFDLLQEFDFPGPNGPGAFAVPLTISGFFMTERDAAPTTFPRLVISKGTAVPVWFVSWPTFAAAAADGVVTMDDLRGMNPVRGTATAFDETLRPRAGEHLLVLNAAGRTEDNRSFAVHITHVADRTVALRLDLK